MFSCFAVGCARTLSSENSDGQRLFSSGKIVPLTTRVPAKRSLLALWPGNSWFREDAVLRSKPLRPAAFRQHRVCWLCLREKDARLETDVHWHRTDDLPLLFRGYGFSLGERNGRSRGVDLVSRLILAKLLASPRPATICAIIDAWRCGPALVVAGRGEAGCFGPPGPLTARESPLLAATRNGLVSDRRIISRRVRRDAVNFGRCCCGRAESLSWQKLAAPEKKGAAAVDALRKLRRRAEWPLLRAMRAGGGGLPSLLWLVALGCGGRIFQS